MILKIEIFWFCIGFWRNSWSWIICYTRR